MSKKRKAEKGRRKLYRVKNASLNEDFNKSCIAPKKKWKLIKAKEKTAALVTCLKKNKPTAKKIRENNK